MERPILFSTAMVQANLNGTKTQTRRSTGLEIINNKPDYWDLGTLFISQVVGAQFMPIGAEDNIIESFAKCKYGKPGDHLWVRETYAKDFYGPGIHGYKTQWEEDKYLNPAPVHKWTPSIHMPRVACRLILDITNIKVERLQDITEADAMAEGVIFDVDSGYYFVADFIQAQSAVDAYRQLWQLINGEDSWNQNPWVWAITYKKAA